MTPVRIRGVIHATTIELASDPGFQHGQVVEVIIRTVEQADAWGDGLRQAAGALSDSWGPEDDEILARLSADRGSTTS